MPKTDDRDKCETNRSGPLHDSRIFWFDAVRGVSALAVCAGHLRSAMFCDSNEILNRSLLHAPFYFCTGLGHQAVMVFFVLSGFFVGGSVLKNRNRFQWTGYAIARLSRLWTVLVPALIFTCIIDFVLSRLAPEAIDGAYFAQWNSGPQPGLVASGPLTFLCNLVFLQTIVSPVYGSNAPLWSLANEFWYYAIFPMVVAVVCPRIRLASILFLTAALSLLLVLPAEMVFAGWIWGLGILVYALQMPVRMMSPVTRRVARIISIGMFFAALVDSKYHRSNAWLPSFLTSDLLIGVAFAVLAFQIVSLESPRSAWIRNSVRWLSDISYSLYLFHFPMIVFVSAVMLGGGQLQPSGSNLLLYLFILGCVLLLCSLCWWMFERNTDAIRKFVLAKIQNARSSGRG